MLFLRFKENELVVRDCSTEKALILVCMKRNRELPKPKH
jgi:hypothetical protein